VIEWMAHKFERGANRLLQCGIRWPAGIFSPAPDHGLRNDLMSYSELQYWRT